MMENIWSNNLRSIAKIKTSRVDEPQHSMPRWTTAVINGQDDDKGYEHSSSRKLFFAAAVAGNDHNIATRLPATDSAAGQAREVNRLH